MRQRVMIAMALAGQPEGADRRRADHRARRHRAGADPRPDPQPAAGVRHGGHPDHPRHGRGRRDGRPRDRHARRADGRERARSSESSQRPRADYTRMLLAAVPRLGAMAGAKPLRDRAARKRDTVVEVRDLTVGFDIKGGLLRRPVAARPRGRGHLVRHRGAARRWRSSANPAAANRRPARRCSASCTGEGGDPHRRPADRTGSAGTR